MTTPLKPGGFLPLLEVFREGLSRGLVSKADVIAWADGIILIEVEPDIFFIDLSLGSDVNGLIEVLGDYTNSKVDLITVRVLLSLIYKKLIGNPPISAEHAASLVGGFWFADLLSSYEYNKVFLLKIILRSTYLMLNC